MNNNLEIAIRENEVAEQLYSQMCESGKESSRLLWEILFEVDVSQREMLVDKIYEYGKFIKEKDHFGRAIFTRLVLLSEVM